MLFNEEFVQVVVLVNLLSDRMRLLKVVVCFFQLLGIGRDSEL